MHKQFEELCALAATGQIEGEAMMLLDQHLKECENCRAFLQAITPLKAHIAPVVAASHARIYEPPDGMRERFLQRAASLGIALRPGPVLDVSSQPSSLETTDVFSMEPTRVPLVCRPRNLFQFAVPVAASILCAIAGYQLALHKLPAPSRAGYFAPVPFQPKADTALVDSEQFEKLRKEGIDSRAQLEKLTSALERIRREKHDLVLKLEEAEKEVAYNDEVRAKYEAATLRLQSADQKVNELVADVATEHSRAASADAVLIAQQRAADEANAKVASLEAQVDGLRDLSNKGQAAEMIAARNLHIVDVYDSESNGDRSKAFGRVFYVEGKSLVFYAYGLPDRTSKKVEFRVWGEQAGIKSVSINLGTMHSDGAGQSRWVLRCNEPKVLAKINAIYVTSDPSSRPISNPHGPKMMYAFLGSANHP